MKWFFLFVTYNAGILVGMALNNPGFPWYWWLGCALMCFVGWNASKLRYQVSEGDRP